MRRYVADALSPEQLDLLGSIAETVLQKIEGERIQHRDAEDRDQSTATSGLITSDDGSPSTAS